MNLPAAFEDKMIKLLGEEEYRRYLDCFDEPRHYGLRVNTAKISVEDFLKIAPWPLKPVPWIRNGFYYRFRGSATGSIMTANRSSLPNTLIITPDFTICRSRAP